MTDAVRKAARGMVRDFGELEKLQVSLKGPADFVTATDKRCDKILREHLQQVRPGYGFLTEESGVIAGTDPDHRWIIDPIDGTTNFMHAVPFLGISIALERKGELVSALIYNPINDEMFAAEKGSGAYVNNQRMRVSNRRRLEDALVCCPLPHRGRPDHALIRLETAALQAKVVGLRHIGSTALELAYVAAGRFDALFARNVKLWDIAAGILLIREAGGIISDCDNTANPLETGNLIAGNFELVPALYKELDGARKGQ